MTQEKYLWNTTWYAGTQPHVMVPSNMLVPSQESDFLRETEYQSLDTLLRLDKHTTKPFPPLYTPLSFSVKIYILIYICLIIGSYYMFILRQHGFGYESHGKKLVTSLLLSYAFLNWLNHFFLLLLLHFFFLCSYIIPVYCLSSCLCVSAHYHSIIIYYFIK